MNEFEGKVVIVTGAAGGIGRATALAFAHGGAKVVAADVDDDGGAETVAMIEVAGGTAIYVRTDVTAADACAALVAKTLATYGQLDIAFNNAGTVDSTPKPVADTSVESWRRVIDVNLVGVFNCMVPELKAMATRGGAIINNASVYGMVGAPGVSAYCASKHGVIGLTRAAALEYGRHSIRVNAICPGYVATGMTVGARAPLSDEGLKLGVSMAAIRRVADPAEIAELVLWLASTRASFVTGGSYPIDGGITAG